MGRKMAGRVLELRTKMNLFEEVEKLATSTVEIVVEQWTATVEEREAGEKSDRKCKGHGVNWCK